MSSAIKIGISTCLLGEKLRYNGSHRLDHFLTETLGKYMDYVSVCPEFECGFDVPREPFRLIGDPNTPRLITSQTKIDCTDRMLIWSMEKLMALEKEALCGFIFKSHSPSCGMARVKVYNERGMPIKKGIGIFARAFMTHFPLLPAEDEGRLHDPKIRENFIEHIFTLKRWRELLKKIKSRGNLVAFHTQHKLLILSHSPEYQRKMGNLVGGSSDIPLDALYEQYQTLFMEALKLKTTIKKNVNVLHHMLGFFKQQLSGDEKQEILEIIDHYHKGSFPLIVPITMMAHYVRKYGKDYLKQQYYLFPHPLELRLRNHV